MKYIAQKRSSNLNSWIGELPDGWCVKRLKYVSSINDETLPENTQADYEMLYVDIGSVDATEGIQKKEPIIFESAPSRARRIVQDGDTIVSTVRTYLRAVATIENPKKNLIVSTGFAIVRPKGINPHYLAYCLRSSYFIETVVSRSVGVSYPATNPTDVSCIEVPLPSIKEQQTIARFLDAKTAQIDNLIAKKRQLIDKLNEKRSALIARTVTRGLPPEAAKAAGLEANPKMKDSGGAWFGLIPSHWDCKPIKHVAQIGNGSTPARDNPDYWEYGEIPWLNSSVVNAGEVLLSDQFVTGAALRQCHLPIVKPPAVLVGITGEGRTRGMAAILLIEATINQHVAYVKPRDALADVRYLWRIFQFAYSFLRSESEGGGSTKGAITCDQIANLKIPLPSVPEQRAIASYLDCEAKKIDKLVAKAFIAIARLTEYRQALITSAVTGKIDVRETPTLPEAA